MYAYALIAKRYNKSMFLEGAGFFYFLDIHSIILSPSYSMKIVF